MVAEEVYERYEDEMLAIVERAECECENECEREVLLEMFLALIEERLS